MRKVFVVLFANGFNKIGVGNETPRKLHSPRFRIRLGVVDGEINIDASDGRTTEPFNDASRVAGGKTSHVEPRPAVLESGFDDESVSFPVADGIAHPGWRWVLRERPAVCKDLPVDRSGFIKEDCDVGGLHDLQTIGNVLLLGNSGWETTHSGMIFAVGLDSLFVERL